MKKFSASTKEIASALKIDTVFNINQALQWMEEAGLNISIHALRVAIRLYSNEGLIKRESHYPALFSINELNHARLMKFHRVKEQ